MRMLITLLVLSTAAFAAPPKKSKPFKPTQQASDKLRGEVGQVVGSISRSSLSEILERGPQPFIASIVVSAQVDGSRFVGYRLDRILANSPLAGSEHVREGDVILSVNGRSLERPGQFMAVWDEIDAIIEQVPSDGNSGRLDLRLLRAGQIVKLSWVIGR